ncbi:MAG: amino acid adenylation domain-containing protein [Acidobacteriota bacterium]
MIEATIADSDIRIDEVRRRLEDYGLDEADVVRAGEGVHTTFRADTADGRRYLFRIYGEHDAATVDSECRWLESLRRETGLRVPEPISGPEGFVTSWAREPAPRPAALFGWVDGEPLAATADPSAYRRLGELMARLHRHGQSFRKPPGFARPRYDLERLLGSCHVLGDGAGERFFTAAESERLDEAAAEARQRLAELGEERDAFGLIHGDLQVTNYLLHEGEAGAIDFADCGWGYYLYDMVTALLPLWGRGEHPAAQEALLNGYRQIRPVSAAHLECLEPMLVARALYVLRWTFGLWDRPAVRRAGEEIVPHLKGQLLHHLERPAGPSAPSSASPSVTGLLGRLRERGVRLWVEDGRLLFKAAKGALTLELRQELKERKGEVLEFLRPAAERFAGRPIVARPRPAEIPLSFAQERLWILAQVDASSPVYNIAQGVRLEGPLDVGVLGRSFREIVRRHESLRTTFPDRDGVPRQEIANEPEVSLQVVDLRRLPAPARRRAADRQAAMDAHRPFDLRRGPPVRFALLRLREDEHLLLTNFHHVISDGWSTGVLLRELAALYEAFLDGRPSPLPALPVQYADFALWQRWWLAGEALDKQIDYWRRQLAGAPNLLELPADRSRPPSLSYRGERIPLAFSAGVAEGLKKTGRQSDATLFMTTLAAFKLLVHRLTGRRDLVMGSPIANRNRGEIEGLIGFFVNTLVLRTQVTAGASFRELLAGIRHTTLEAYAHQDLPFEKLVEELSPERSAAHAPLFQMAFALQNAPMPPWRLPGLTLTPEPTEKNTAKFDLTVGLWEDDDGALAGVLTYSTDLYDRTTLLRLVGQFGRVLEQVTADPTVALSEVALLGAGERHELLVEWNATEVAYPRDLCVHELFEEQVRRAREAPALLYADTAWSYGELNERANRLAHHLRRLGVGTEALVAICLGRSPELVMALVAVLKAGGVYVPLDPALPAERLRILLEDSRATALVTRRELLAEVDLGGVATVDVADDAASIAAADAANPTNVTTARNLAYVLFTSGSTGRPKAVGVPHRGVVRLVRGVDYATLGSREVVLQLARMSFDASTFEVWGSLLHGAALAIPEAAHPSVDDIAATVERHQVSTILITPGPFHLMVSEQLPVLSKVGQVLAGGDVLSVPHVRKLLDAPGERRVVDVYGPTESTTFTSCHSMWHSDEVERTVSIGRPISNTRVHLVDPLLRPVPLGMVGELVIAGDGLARAYLGSAHTTAERFVPDPLGVAPGDRLYRSGDLARYLGDGRIEFLGRFDHQVKIRGFRIEPGEVETALDRHPAVKKAVVVAYPGPGSEKELVAFLVATEELTIEALRRFLRQDLPEYMLPSRFVTLEQMPLSANGKVDRAALLRSSGDALASEVAYVAPRTPLEEGMAEIWAELLGGEQLGVHDNFFDRGGTSLLATQVLSRMRSRFAVELTLASFFEAPTVADLAQSVEVIRRARTAGSRDSAGSNEAREEGEL